MAYANFLIVDRAKEQLAVAFGTPTSIESSALLLGSETTCGCFYLVVFGHLSLINKTN